MEQVSTDDKNNDDEKNSDREEENAASTSLDKSGDEKEEDEDEDNMDKIRRYLAQKLRLTDATDEPQKKILNRLDIDGIVEYIKEHNCSNIITMAGAGISTSAGIPDFRSPSSGLYHNLQKYNLPHPQAIFELDFFKSNPEPFFVLAKQLLPEGFKPTLSHYFIKLLHKKGLLLRHYTQNVDTLERVAGLPADKLVEAHGTFHTGRCLKCRCRYDLDWMKKKIIENIVPKCEECNEGVVKPDIVFFGEMLPDRFHRLIEEDFPKADLLIIMGSSLVVQPFASLIDSVNNSCPRLLINKEKVGMQHRLSRLFGLHHGFVFDSKSSDNARDVAWIGDCDMGCQLLADKLDWSEELKNLMETEHQRLDAEKS